MEINITRKCAYCKEYINLDNENFVDIKDKYYHFDCAVNEQLNKKRNKLSKEQCIKKFLDTQKESKKEVECKIIKDKLFRWLHNTYNTVVLPKTFYVKMNDIFIGQYIGMSKGIPPEDLFDMWKRKKNELDRINAFNNKKGKVLIGCARIQYDLAILLSKYDSYLKWKEQQKLLEDEKQNIITEANKPKINYELINKSIEKNHNTTTNINDLLDEVF
jgi:hypothetical protein